MCAEKNRLLDLLRLANHELSSVVKDVGRLAVEKPDKTTELRQLLASAKEARQKVLADYTGHVVEHGCGTVAEATATSGDD